jgi:hypothetical protein
LQCSWPTISGARAREVDLSGSTVVDSHFGNRPLQNDGRGQVREGYGGAARVLHQIQSANLQVAFLVRARGMISFEFYLVLKNVFALSACKFDEQKRPAKVFGD